MSLDQLKEAMKIQITEKTKQVFESAITESMSSKMKKESDIEDVENSDDKDDDDDEDDDDDDTVEEAMKVVATKLRKKGESKYSNEEHTINRYQDLVNLAKTGDYEFFMVTKSNGDETEYHVDFNGKTPKLVEM